jgi:hypothetical protein
VTYMIPKETLEGILAADGNAQEIAQAFGVSPTTVFLTKRLESKKARECAAKMTNAVVWPAPERLRHNFTPAQIDYIRANSMTSKAMAAQANCSPSLIRMIRTGRAYR